MQGKRAVLIILCAIVMPVAMFAQPALYTQKAELAVPFGVITGRLVAVGPYLVFVDEEKPEASVAVAREDVREFSLTGDGLTLSTAKPVRLRDADRTQFTFRFAAGSDSTGLGSWYKSVPAAAAKVAPDEGGKTMYEAKHDHRLGSCTGRLIIEPNRLMFESVTDIGHSREWALRDIKELRRDNAYGIKLIPFNGDTYNLGLAGQGMGNEEFRALVDRVTAARVK